MQSPGPSKSKTLDSIANVVNESTLPIYDVIAVEIKGNPYLRLNRGLEETRAWTSTRNGRGAWWNAGAPHMNAAYTKLDFDQLGLVSLLDTILKLHNQSRTAVYGTVRTVV